MLRVRFLIVGLLVFGVGGIGVAAASTVLTPGAQNGFLREATRVQRAAPARASAVEIEASAQISGSVAVRSNQNASRDMANAIVRQYRAPLLTVLRLRNSGWSYADIFRLYDYSKLSGKSPALIRTMRNAGIDWSNIAEALNLRPGGVDVNLRGNLALTDVVTGTLELSPTQSVDTP